MKRFLIIAALVLLSPIASAKSDICASFLDTPAGHSASVHYAALKRHFAENRQVLFQEDPVTDRSTGNEFFASNEFDWLRGQVDHTPADLVIGFATNNVWDVAVRRNAKAMIIGDIISGPLLAQEYILRPIFELARTRTEFISMLQGVRVPEENTRLTDIFEQVLTETHERRRTDPEVVDGILQRVMANPKLGPVYAQALARNYRLADLVEHGFAKRSQIPLLDTDQSPALYPGRPATLGGLSIDYYLRYSPSQAPHDLLEQARAALRDPFFSFLASEEAYQFLRRMFMEGRVYYVRSDFSNQKIYQAAARLMQQHGYASVAVTTSNIADVVAEADPNRSNQIYRAYVEATNATLRAGGARGTIPFMQTRRCRPPHSFECHNISEGTTKPDLRFQDGSEPSLDRLLRSFRTFSMPRASGE